LAREWLPADKAIETCTWHRRPGAPAEYPPDYQAWLAERFSQGRAAKNVSGTAQIRFPVSGSVFYYNSALPPEAQAVRIETAGFSSGALVYSDEVLQGSLNYAGVFALPLRRGAHRITVEDETVSCITEIIVR
jgi:penicillin-binding protein 1C